MVHGACCSAQRWAQWERQVYRLASHMCYPVTTHTTQHTHVPLQTWSALSSPRYPATVRWCSQESQPWPFSPFFSRINQLVSLAEGSFGLTRLKRQPVYMTRRGTSPKHVLTTVKPGVSLVFPMLFRRILVPRSESVWLSMGIASQLQSGSQPGSWQPHRERGRARLSAQLSHWRSPLTQGRLQSAKTIWQ